MGCGPFFTFNKQRDDLLNTAATLGHANLCERLINLGCDPNRPVRRLRDSSLGKAICYNMDDTARLLLEHDASPDQVVNDGCSLLCEETGFGSEWA